MKELLQWQLRDGSLICIEDWHENYDFMPYASTIAAYAKSKITHDGTYAPKAGERYRFQFDFSSGDEAKTAFCKLISGETKLSDYADRLADKKYADCI